jgi:hypothetical protein
VSFATEVSPVDLAAFLLHVVMGFIRRRKFQSKLFAQKSERSRMRSSG